MNTDNLNLITDLVIGAAIEVHRCLGPGLLESVYEKALSVEFSLRNIPHERQKEISIEYKNMNVGSLFIDFVIKKSVVVEIKSSLKHESIFEAQLLSYMKLGNYTLGLLINFNNILLKNGIKRFKY